MLDAACHVITTRVGRYLARVLSQTRSDRSRVGNSGNICLGRWHPTLVEQSE